MLIDAALGLANHLLVSEDWAHNRLKAFAGQTARLQLGALNFPLEITADGRFRTGDKNATSAVTITLPADAPIRAVTDRASLLVSAQIRGSADLAECLGFVFRNLRWDVESDLSQVFGDIAARRLVQGGKQLAAWPLAQARSVALNLAEYFTEERPAIARQQDVSSHCGEINRMQTQLKNLEKRIGALERLEN